MLVAVPLAACQLPYAEECSTVEVKAGARIECTMNGYTDRAFDLRVPDGWDGASPLPLIVASLHGTIVGDVPVDGFVTLFGLAIAHDF